MVDKTTHDDYIRIYKELIERLSQKEDTIEKMVNYIAKNAKKTNEICNGNFSIECNIWKCKKCVRKYFEL